MDSPLTGNARKLELHAILLAIPRRICHKNTSTHFAMITNTTLHTFIFAGLFSARMILSAAEPEEIPLWPNGAPGSEGKIDQEVVKASSTGEISVWSIHNPSLTPYLPAKDKATGTAILVIPGGG